MRLALIIGRQTFSSGMMNAITLHTWAGGVVRRGNGRQQQPLRPGCAADPDPDRDLADPLDAVLLVSAAAAGIGPAGRAGPDVLGGLLLAARSVPGGGAGGVGTAVGRWNVDGGERGKLAGSGGAGVARVGLRRVGRGRGGNGGREAGAGDRGVRRTGQLPGARDGAAGNRRGAVGNVAGTCGWWTRRRGCSRRSRGTGISRSTATGRARATGPLVYVGQGARPR